MKPLGLQHYNNKVGGKHFCKIDGKKYTWWNAIISPNKRKFNNLIQSEIENEISGNYDDVTHCFPEIISKFSNSKIQILYHDVECEYCIYADGIWKGYVEI